jgi:hypothetical protein
MASVPREVDTGKLGPEAIKHLELIQTVITRMAANSFLLKGWTVAVVAGLFALAGSNHSWMVAAAAIVPSLSFWVLDAYYLRQERLFRKLYEAVREGQKPEKLFSMNTAAYVDVVHSVPRTMVSKSIVYIHGILVLAVVGVTVVLHYNPKGT